MQLHGKLRRTKRNRLVAGVCAGIAEWLGWKVGRVRAFFIIGSFIPIVPGFLVYLLLWAVLPLEDSEEATQ
ncbi:MAG: PspC domain-containing protein [Ignavibacteriae bacterium]|nr:PspC domain-containing protein [Ignavibacteriota bacterium]